MWVRVTSAPNHSAIILTPGLPQLLLLMWMKISHKNNGTQKVKLTIVPLPTTKPREQQWDPLVRRGSLVFASASRGPHGVACRRETDGSITTRSLTFLLNTDTVINLSTEPYHPDL